MGKKLCMVYWATVKLTFMKRIEFSCCEKNIKYQSFEFSHHPDWFTKKRSRYFKNVCFLVKQIFRFIFLNYRGAFVLFGTNLCRLLYPIFFFRKDIFFIYNEYPSLPGNHFLLFLYDWLIMRTVKHIYVSSIERKKLCEYIFGIHDKIGIVNNLSYGKYVVNPEELFLGKEDKMIFAGIISSGRFNSAAIKLLNESPIPLLFIGKKEEQNILNLLDAKHEYLGKLSQDEAIAMQRKCRYALLSYDQNTLNNDYCAPVKIYEYVDSCCVVVSLLKNQGLMTLFTEYSQLFCWYDNFVKGYYKFDQIKYIKQRTQFLAAAEAENSLFYKQICDALL